MTSLSAKLYWRPIETAPHDGTSVLLSFEGDVHEGQYHPDEDGWWLANSHPTDYWDGRIYPDAWMPMPESSGHGQKSDGGNDAAK